MRVSVITPVLNGGKTIRRTLDSLAKQNGDYEHIVMDGGSVDETEQLVKNYLGTYPLEWHQQPDKSVFEGMWNGCCRARGDIMGTIFADDFYMPWTIATVQSVFETHPTVEWIMGLPSWYFEEERVGMTTSYAPVFPQWAVRRGLATSRLLGFPMQECIFWRRSLWERAEPKDILLRYRYAADHHLWKRFARFAELRTLTTVLACFTVSKNQISGKFRSKYLAECGIQRDTFEMGFAKRLIARGLSTALWWRLLKVRSTIR